MAQLNRKLLASAVASLVCAGSAHAALVVYEGFNYGTPGGDQVNNFADPNYNLLHLQPDGVGGDVNATGLSGAWNDMVGPGDNTGLFLSPGSLSFGDLPTTGNHVRSDTNLNNDNHVIAISGAMPTSGEMWFSILANKLQNNFSAAEGGFVIGNQQVNNTRVLNDNGSTGLQGFGIAPTTAGNNWTAYGWDGSSQTVGGASLGVATNGSETNLLVGKVEFDAGTGGADIYTLYQYQLNAGSITGGTLNEITSIEVDVDQSTLDTLSLTRQVNSAYDEIRIATTLDEALGVPEPGSLTLLGLGGLLIARRRRA